MDDGYYTENVSFYLHFPNHSLGTIAFSGERVSGCSQMRFFVRLGALEAMNPGGNPYWLGV